MTIRDLCREALKNPAGMVVGSINASPNSVSGALHVLSRRGECFIAVVSYKSRRYFGTAKARDAFMASRVTPRGPIALRVMHTRTRAQWPADAEPVITSATKVTIAPSPRLALWTNTHNRW
jgi:hypothetical protein